MRRIAGHIFLIAMLATPAFAEVKGTFIGPGTYATAEGCVKLKAIAAGTARNVSTVPETLTMDGFLGWEGACSFRSITETVKGKTWKASMDCYEGADEGPESDIFERLPDGSIKVTVMGKETTFVRCDGEKGK
jgi:hypothetical protein